MKRLAGKTMLILLAFLAGMGITAMGLKKPDALRPACGEVLSFGMRKQHGDLLRHRLVLPRVPAPPSRRS